MVFNMIYFAIFKEPKKVTDCIVITFVTYRVFDRDKSLKNKLKRKEKAKTSWILKI